MPLVPQPAAAPGLAQFAPFRGGCHVEVLALGQLEVSPDLARCLAPDHPPQLPAFTRELLRPGTAIHLTWFCHVPNGLSYTRNAIHLHDAT